MPERVRVVQVITKLALGGAQETVLALCSGLDPARYEVTVMCGPETDAEGDLWSEFRAAGVAIEIVPSLGRSVRALGDARALASVTQAMRRVSPDVVHTHTSKAGAIGRVAARVARVTAVVHTVHGWSFDHRGGTFSRPMIEAERALSRWCDRLVVVTPADQEKGLASRIGKPDQYRLVRSGIDVSKFAFAPADRLAIRERVGISPTATVIGSVGRLTEQKDTRTLVHAFERIAVAHADTHLVVVGDGPRRYELEQTIIDAGLVGRVHLVGAQHDPALWYSAMDVFALSSRWEGLPRAALEAAASGLAIVSTRCGGMEELERHGIASLCAVGDDASLAGLLHRALVNLPASRITPAFLDEYSVSAMVSRTEALYDELSLLRVAS